MTTNENYVVWNLPQTYPDGSYQVYGFVYPNWPQTEPFPPYPFQRTLCIGIPIWSVAPYIQTYKLQQPPLQWRSWLAFNAQNRFVP